MRKSTAIALAATTMACATEPTFHQDVKPIFDAHCVSCHSEGGIGPFPLTAETSVSWANAIKRAVTERTMPPWFAEPACAEYENDLSLTDEQIATIAAWADAGAPLGRPSSKATTPPEPPKGLSRVDRSLSMPVAYAPVNAPDDYRCFLIDWPETATKFVTGFAARPGNQRIVHHLVAFIITPDQVAAFEQLDADEDGEGYTCFGGPGGPPRAANWLGVWVPGEDGGDLPAGTGQRIEPGSKIVVQVHYNVTNAASGDTDLTTIDLTLEDEVEKEAVTLPFANPTWPFGGTMPIPAGEKDVTHSFQVELSKHLALQSKGVLENDEPVLIHSAFLHMHKLGVRGDLQLIKRATSTTECLLDIDRWDFHWQRTYRFKEPKRLDPGDQLFIECGWDNSGAKHGVREDVRDVAWGEGTGDEMCLGVIYVSKL